MGIRRLSIWECAIRGPGKLGLEVTLQEATDWLRGAEEFGEIRGTV